MTKRGQTPSQTVGPFFAFGLTAEQYGYPFTQLPCGKIAGDGERIAIKGQVLDGEGQPVRDAMVELWQGGTGFARQGTGANEEGTFIFETVKPEPSAPGRAPSIDVIVFMRGLLSHLNTRLYFEDEVAANAEDPVLASLDEGRRGTLIARREVAKLYRFDIHLQGPRETAFFDV